MGFLDITPDQFARGLDFRWLVNGEWTDWSMRADVPPEGATEGQARGRIWPDPDNPYDYGGEVVYGLDVDAYRASLNPAPPEEP